MNLLKIISILLLVSCSLILNGQKLRKKPNAGVGDGDVPPCAKCDTSQYLFNTTQVIPFSTWNNENIEVTHGTVTKQLIPEFVFSDAASGCNIYEYEIEVIICCENCPFENAFCPDSAVITFSDGNGNCLFTSLDPSDYFNSYCLLLYDYHIDSTYNVTEAVPDFKCSFEIHPNICCDEPPGNSNDASARITNSSGAQDRMIGNGDLSAAVQIDNRKMLIFPNPTTGYTDITNISKGDRILVLDYSGQILKAVKVHDDTRLRIELNEYPPGLYFIQRVTDTSIVEIQKVFRI